ncbi:MAG: hypothetical protein V1659_01355 [Candidatus Woesearchaeota archaeon]
MIKERRKRKMRLCKEAYLKGNKGLLVRKTKFYIEDITGIPEIDIFCLHLGTFFEPENGIPSTFVWEPRFTVAPINKNYLVDGKEANVPKFENEAARFFGRIQTDSSARGANPNILASIFAYAMYSYIASAFEQAFGQAFPIAGAPEPQQTGERR